MQIQSLRILAMNTQELQKFCLQEQTDNPVLEIGSFSEAPPNLVEQQSWLERNTTRISGGRAETPERVLSSLAQPESPSVKEQLLQQVNERRLPAGVGCALRRLCCLLDENGWLGVPEDRLPALTQSEPEVCGQALRLLRSLEPAGIGARDLPHCLLLQLERYGRLTPLLAELVTNHFEELAAGQSRRLSKALNIPKAEVDEAVAVLQMLAPHPAAGMTAGQTEYIVPDILAHYTEDGWEVEINDSWCGSIHMNPTYLAMAEHAETEEERAYFTEKIRRARAVVSSIEQRRRTIVSIVRFMLQKQQAFVLYGAPLQPLTMQEVAEALHIHISTVSRTVRGKYVQCPRSVLPLGGLLEAAAPRGAQEQPSVGRSEIVRQLRALIAREDPAKPFSDAALAEQINRLCGVQLSRRTVAKYRQENNIKGAYERRVEK